MTANTTQYITQNCFFKEFKISNDDEEFEYHLDKTSRFLKVLNTSDWMFQFKDVAPQKMTKGMVIHISKKIKHKMIKGTTNLSVQVLEVL